MDEIMKRIIVQILKKTGFESVESKALEMLLEVYNDRICSFLNTVSRRTIHSLKPSTSFIDILSMKNEIFQIGKELPLTSEMLNECNVTVPKSNFRKVQKIFSVVAITRENFPEELIEPELEWTSPITTKVEKYIHIYDYMPSFPPIHTFRMTAMRQSNSKHQSTKVKNRLEQSLSSEGNMVKLIKSSGTMPKFINFLYKGRM